MMGVILVRIRTRTFCSFLVCKQGASGKHMIREAIDRQVVLLCSFTGHSVSTLGGEKLLGLQKINETCCRLNKQCVCIVEKH
jgi:hypothetical protein